MTARMSVSMTLDAVRERRKTVTRRHVDSWRNLHVGDRLLLIEKGQGLKRGEHQVVVAEVVVTAVDVIPLWPVGPGEILAEGLLAEARAAVGLGGGGEVPSKVSTWFCRFWLKGHGYPPDRDPATVQCRRIAWRYVDA